jgi:cellulose synthase/poly-beta-1,6-N-acetylglucosamine synthase-like glycosyltransferase
MINLGLKKDGISHQEKAYISREVLIKNREGIIWGAMMGPFGGCYAIRKEDFKPIPPNYLVDDFYINMSIFEKGKLAINEPEARVYEEIPDDLKVEFRRKIRIGTGNWQNLRTFTRLLFSPRYGFAFWSHKVIRWLGPFLLIIALFVNIYLATFSGLYFLILLCQFAVILLPLLDYLLKKIGIHVSVLRLATHFYSMNAALFIGFFKSFKTIRSGVWERTKRE